MEAEEYAVKLDPVTFEVLKNSFVNLVDQMREHISRTCYSLVIYVGDASCCLNDARGDTIAQGSRDVAVHVGTLHSTAKAALAYFKDDLYPGDILAINDPYMGGTHISDVRIIKPVYHDGDLVALTQCNGHWADVGGPVSGSFNIRAKEHYAEGLRITPVKIAEKGKFRRDVADMIAANMRISEERIGDLKAQAAASEVGEQYLLRLIKKYGKKTVLAAFNEVQDYVERVMKARIAKLPKGTWENEDYLDQDPDKGEGLIKVHIKMKIKEHEIFYDLSGSDPYVGTFLNGTESNSYSAVVAGTKYYFPDIPLNSGFYRVVKAYFPPDSVVNAPWPIAVTGFCSGTYEKIMNSIFEIWSRIIPERSLAACFNLEYLLVGGWDDRPGYNRHFMWYDWNVGGWGGRSARDGHDAAGLVFGPGVMTQPVEAQERLNPILTTKMEIIRDSGGPGKWRGGCGVEKGAVLLPCKRTEISYCADRERSIAWGIFGGLPSIPQGLTLNPGKPEERYLGVIFSDVLLRPGDSFTRPSAGGGGLGDPLQRDPSLVLEDVIDGYVSISRARKDYGVVIKEIDPDLCQYEIDLKATKRERQYIRKNRRKWLQEDPDTVRNKLLKGKIDFLDTIRKYGVILDRATYQVLPKTTNQFREMLQRRAVAYWR